VTETPRRFRQLETEYTGGSAPPRFYLVANAAERGAGLARIYDSLDKTLDAPRSTEALLRFGIWVPIDEEAYFDLPGEMPQPTREARATRVPRDDEDLSRLTIGGPTWSRARNPLRSGMLEYAQLRRDLSTPGGRPLRVLVFVNPTERASAQFRALKESLVSTNDRVMLVAAPKHAIALEELRETLAPTSVRLVNLERDAQFEAVYETGLFDVVLLSGHEAVGMGSRSKTAVSIPSDRFESRARIVIIDGAGPTASSLVDSFRDAATLVGLTYPLADKAWRAFDDAANASLLVDCIVHILESLDLVATERGLDPQLLRELKNFGRAIQASDLSEAQHQEVEEAMRSLFESGRFEHLLCRSKVKAALEPVAADC
jgi:hypothetical protein